MNELPLSRLISASVNLQPQAAQAQSTSSLLLLGTSEVIDVAARFAEYGSVADLVSAGFLTTSPEYLGAVAWFGQNPAPTSLLVGRWAKTNSKGQLIGGALSAVEQTVATWALITNGAFKVTVDAGVEQSVTGLTFAAATTMAQVAAVVQGGLTGCAVTWDAYNQRFVFTSASTGAASTVSFLTTGASGTNIAPLLKGTALLGAYAANGLVAETAVQVATLFDINFGQHWYGLIIPEGLTADHQAVAAYVEAASNKHLYGVTTQDANSLVTANTSHIGYLLKAANYNKSVVQYSSASAYAVASLLARILTTNYSANRSVITLMYKQEPGVTAENLNSTQANALQASNINVFVAYNNNTSIIQNGTVASGNFVDTVAGTDWLALTLQTAVYNLLYTSTSKIPQTDAGVNILQSVVEGVLFQGVNNGLLAPGTWNQAGIGNLLQGDFLPKGYYVYAVPMSQQSAADRAARKAPVMQVAAKLAGAVHTADIIINVNP